MQKLTSSLKYIFSIALGMAIVATVSYAAGSLTPPSGTPAPTGYTLDDIYNNLTSGISAGEHTISTTTSPNPSFRSLTEIYNAGVALRASSVSLVNMWNGTGQGITGGSQASGGVDDYNNGGAIPSGRYASTWTQCTVGDTPVAYCGTNDPGASYKDNATGLVWSYLCHGEGCSSWDTSAPNLETYGNDPNTDPTADSYYTWDDTGTPKSWYSGNAGKDAYTLCSQVHKVDGNDYTGWSLPGQKQLMQAYIDGSYGTLEPVDVNRNYWSATTFSNFSTFAWYVNLSYGYTGVNDETGNNSIRCVRE